MTRSDLRNEVFAAYGGPVCVCCGEYELMFLTLDHTYNDGAAVRRIQEAKKGRKIKNLDIYRLLKAEGYPQDRGIRVMCWNCNCGRARNDGVCPHETRRIGEKWTNRKTLLPEDIDFIRSQKGSKGPRSRTSTRLSLQELSVRFGISPATLFKIQNGLPNSFAPADE